MPPHGPVPGGLFGEIRFHLAPVRVRPHDRGFSNFFPPALRTLRIDQIELAIDDASGLRVGAEQRPIAECLGTISPVLRGVFRWINHEHFAVLGIGELPRGAQPTKACGKALGPKRITIDFTF